MLPISFADACWMLGEKFHCRTRLVKISQSKGCDSVAALPRKYIAYLSR